MRPEGGDEWPAGWDALSAQLDRQTTVDQAIGVLMERQNLDYWAAMRVLMVASIESDVTVHAQAQQVLRDLGLQRG